MAKYPPSPPPRTAPYFHTVTNENITQELLRQYLSSYIYIWPRNGGRSFWMYPVVLERDRLRGYGWNGVSWKSIWLDIRYIQKFY